MRIIIANTTNVSGGGFGHKEAKMYRELPLIFTEGKEAQKARKREKEKVKLKEEWIEEKAIELFNYLYYRSFNLKQIKDFLHSFIKESAGK